jgi:hypothetical protein
MPSAPNVMLELAAPLNLSVPVPFVFKDNPWILMELKLLAVMAPVQSVPAANTASSVLPGVAFVPT